MSVAIALLRHGETGARGFRGRSDDALTALGFDQMGAAVAGSGSWSYVLSSPLRRCADFARAFAAERQLPCTVDARLQELDFGAWEGRTNEQLLREDAVALQAFWADPWRFAPTGGESLLVFAERVFAALADLARQDLPGRGLVVTHGGVIRLCLAKARGRMGGDLATMVVTHGTLCPLRLEEGPQGLSLTE